MDDQAKKKLTQQLVLLGIVLLFIVFFLVGNPFSGGEGSTLDDPAGQATALSPQETVPKSLDEEINRMGEILKKRENTTVINVDGFSDGKANPFE